MVLIDQTCPQPKALGKSWRIQLSASGEKINLKMVPLAVPQRAPRKASDRFDLSVLSKPSESTTEIMLRRFDGDA